MTLIKLSLWSDPDGNRRGGDVYVNPSEIAAIKSWRYHSFRDDVGEVILNTGEKIHVWETPEAIVKLINKAKAT
jgi:hypothetical protein